MIETSIIFIFASMMVLSEALTFSYLYWFNRDPILKEWTIAWYLYAFRFLILAVDSYYHVNIFFHMLEDIFLILFAYFLVRSTLWLTKKVLPTLIILIPIGLIFLNAIEHLVIKQSIFHHWETYIAAGLSLSFIGIRTILYSNYPQFLRIVLGSSLIIWGGHKISYNFFTVFDWGKYLSLSLSLGLSLVVALSFLLIYYQRRWKMLEHSKKYSQSLFELSPIGLALVDNQGRLVATNRTLQEMLGYNEQELNHVNFTQITPLSYSDLDQEMFTKLKIEGKITPFRKLYIKKSGNLIPVEINGVRIKSEDNENEIYLCTIKNLTDILFIEQKLKNKVEEAKQASVAKDNFLATISHELRTPLHSICGMAELLQQRLTTQDEQLLMNKIVKNSNLLMTLINDVLDITQAEEDRIQFEFLPVNLEELMGDVVQLFSERLKEKLNTLKIKFNGDLKQMRLGDPTRIKQILINLIGNSIKFTTRGMIEVHVSEAEDMVNFMVKDNGIGIPGDMIDKIFDPFTQADASITRRFGGSGMGLTISKLLINKMKGTIEVSSQDGSGTCFKFDIYLPLTNQKPNSLFNGEQTPSINGPCKILIVDDALDNLLLLELFLKGTIVEIDKANNGKEALDMMKLNSYSLVVMDIQMPIMDGITAVGLYREWELTQSSRHFPTPIIALTADALTVDHERCIQLGFTDHLLKPIKQKELISTLQKNLFREI